MAWSWNFSPVATVKIQESDSTNMFTINGCTRSNVPPDTAANLINILLDIGGKSAEVNEKMTRTSKEEAADNV